MGEPTPRGEMQGTGPMLRFVVVGPQRTASSWTDRMLRQHDTVRLPHQVKETSFFDERFERGWEWYWSHFRDPEGGVPGEVGPTYFDSEEARSRLAEHNPSLHVVIGLRDPVERAYSLYCHHRGLGRVRGAFRDAAAQMPRIVESGRYTRFVPRWIETFGPERVFLLHQECVRTRPDEVLNELCDFLGLERRAGWDGSGERYGPRPRPRSVILAKAAGRTAAWFRNRGFHAVAQAGRALGLKKLLLHSGGSHPPLDEAARSWLTEEYADDLAWLEGVRASGPAQEVRVQ